LITSFTETEKEMVSVERAHQFESIEPENWLGIEETPSGWPQQPLIEYIDCVLQYIEDGVNALNGISLRINPGQKIGICGRTGSGKSSMFMALFRGEELKSGTIKIDNVNSMTTLMYSSIVSLLVYAFIEITSIRSLKDARRCQALLLLIY
jgi:ATP-binding cassette subfamily C (CFTR/MRP) protein 10